MNAGAEDEAFQAGCRRPGCGRIGSGRARMAEKLG